MTDHEHANTQPTAGGETRKLSALIREGAAMVDGRQEFYDYIKHESDGIHLCALGAAYYALTGELPLTREREQYTENTPIRMLKRAGFDGQDLYEVRGLNDDDNMTFGEIVALLEEWGL